MQGKRPVLDSTPVIRVVTAFVFLCLLPVVQFRMARFPTRLFVVSRCLRLCKLPPPLVVHYNDYIASTENVIVSFAFFVFVWWGHAVAISCLNTWCRFASSWLENTRTLCASSHPMWLSLSRPFRSASCYVFDSLSPSPGNAVRGAVCGQSHGVVGEEPGVQAAQPLGDGRHVGADRAAPGARPEGEAPLTAGLKGWVVQSPIGLIQD